MRSLERFIRPWGGSLRRILQRIGLGLPLAFGVLLAGPAMAAPVAGTDEPAKRPERGLEIFAEQISKELKPAPDGSMITILRKGVKIVDVDLHDETTTVTTITADNAVIWLKRKAAPGKPAPEMDRPLGGGERGDWEAYAEGDVRIEVTGTIDGKPGVTTVTRCDRLYYSFGLHRAVLFNGWIKLSDAATNLSVYIRGNTIRQTGERKFEIANSVISTCPFGHPHTSVRSKNLTVTVRTVRERGKTTQQTYLEADENYIVSGSTPVFYWPHFSGRATKLDYIKSVEGGSSSRFGTFARAKWDLQDFGVLDNDWSLLSARTDFFSKRGFGYGTDFRYSRDDEFGIYGGDFELYEIRDKGKDRRGRVRVEPEVNDRGRIKLRHHHQFDEHWFAILEVSKISDRGFLDEFFRREFREDKDQENVAYLRWIDSHVMVTTTGKVRANDFLTQTEYLPRVTGSLFHEAIAETGATVAMDWEVSHVRRRIDEGIAGMGHRVMRFDANNEIARPFDLGPVRVRPFLGLRGTAFDNTVDEGGTVRWVGSTGARVSTRWHREYGLTSEVLGLDGLRHIFYPDVRVYSVFEATKRSRSLLANDSVEEVDRLDVIRFGLRNVFQTKRTKKDGEGKERTNTFTFLTSDVEINYYPNEDRDNPRGARFKNFVLLAPAGSGSGRSLSNLRIENNYYYNERTSLTSEFGIDTERGRLDESRTTLRYGPTDRAYARIGHTLVRNNGTSDFAAFSNIFVFNSSLETPISTISTITDEELVSVLSLGGSAPLGEKWEVAFNYSVDVENSRGQRQAFTLRRFFHELAMDIRFKRDFADKNTAIFFSITTGRQARQLQERR